MKNAITIIAALMLTVSIQAQLASFTTKGYEDSDWFCMLITVEDEELVSTYLPLTEDDECLVYGDLIEWNFFYEGAYLIRMTHEGKTQDFYINVQSGSEIVCDPDKVFNMKRRSYFFD